MVLPWLKHRHFYVAIAVLSVALAGALVYFSSIPTEAVDQGAYRWRNDDGTEVSATWAAPENTPIYSVPKFSPKRLRFGIAADPDESEFLYARQDMMWSSDLTATTAVLDNANEFAYLGTYTSPARIIKVDVKNAIDVDSPGSCRHCCPTFFPGASTCTSLAVFSSTPAIACHFVNHGFSCTSRGPCTCDRAVPGLYA